MSDLLTAAAAIAAAAVYVARTAYEYVVRTKDNIRENGHSGKLQESMNAQTKLLEEIKGDMRDTRDGVRELVALSRRS